MEQTCMTFNSEQIKRLENYMIKIIVQNCTPEAAKDTSLPRDSYLLTLDNGEEQWYDVVRGLKGNIFDAYYDTFGHCIKSMEWTDGKIPAKLWSNMQDAPPETKKKK